MRRSLVVPAALIVVAVMLFALTGCGSSDASKAKEYAANANKVNKKLEQLGTELNTKIQAVFTDTFSGSTVDKAKFEAGAAEVKKLADEMVAEVESAKKDYEKITKLKGVEKYVEFADTQIALIELNTQMLAKIDSFLDETAKVLSDEAQRNSLMQQFQGEVQAMSSKASELEKKAKKLQEDNKLF